MAKDDKFDINRIKTIVLLNDLRRSLVYKEEKCLVCDPVSFVHKELPWEEVIQVLMDREEKLLGIKRPPDKGD